MERRHTGCCGTALDGRASTALDAPPATDEAGGTSPLADVGGFGPTVEHFIDTTIRACGADACVIRMLTDADDARLHLVGVSGLDRDVAKRQQDVSPNCGICGDAVAEGRALTRSAGCACSRGGTAERPLRQVAAVPVIGGDQTIGVLSIFFSDSAELSDRTMTTLKSMADLIGMTLDQAVSAEIKLRQSLAQERQMMGNEIHDSLCQTLAYMKMRMRMLQDAVHQHDELRAFRYITDCNEALAEVQSRARELITHYRIRVDQGGLLRAFESLAAEFGERTGIALAFENHAPDLILPAEQEAQVLRIVQEAVANVGKHSKARRARLGLSRVASGYRIEIEDDGIGISRREGAGESNHFGLDIMRERARCIGGQLSIETAQNKGTRVCLTFPGTLGGRSTSL